MPTRIIFPARGEVALEDFQLPQPGAHEIRVRTLYSLMSIGTETIILNQKYDPDTHFADIFSFPQLQTGVQSVAEVETIGSNVTEFKPGDHIYMRMGHGSHQLMAAKDCSPIPPGMDLKQACWAGLAKTAHRAAWAGHFEPGQHILIIGAGPVGQMAIRWASHSGADAVAVVDLSTTRLTLAKQGGATQVFNADIADCLDDIQSLNAGNGPSIVVDVTGNAAVFQHALAAAARFGKVILLGDTGYPSRQRLSSDVMTKGLTIQATHDSHDRDGWTERRIDALFFDLVLRGEFDLSGLLTHEFLPGDCAQAYALADEQRAQVMGILFDWSDSE
ncbi:MAG: zinc-binding alcohol dehydrogenase [Pseudomonadota bacterium]|nr:zinc-binding alcohol dehydrogenase [Pseudomonadota bacterium]